MYENTHYPDLGYLPGLKMQLYIFLEACIKNGLKACNYRWQRGFRQVRGPALLHQVLCLGRERRGGGSIWGPITLQRDTAVLKWLLDMQRRNILPEYLGAFIIKPSSSRLWPSLTLASPPPDPCLTPPCSRHQVLSVPRALSPLNYLSLYGEMIMIIMKTDELPFLKKITFSPNIYLSVFFLLSSDK